MIATFHSIVNTVMIEQHGQLLHMDTVGPSRVHSMGSKWHARVIIDDYSRYSWVFFLESKDEVFEHFQSLALRLNNEHPNCLKAIHSDNGTEFRNALSVVLMKTGQVRYSDGRTIGRSGDVVCGLHHAQGAHVSWFNLKTKVDDFFGLASKPVATILIVWPQNHLLGFTGLGLKTDNCGLVIWSTKSL
jgi:hypothetical protein